MTALRDMGQAPRSDAARLDWVGNADVDWIEGLSANEANVSVELTSVSVQLVNILKHFSILISHFTVFTLIIFQPYNT